MNVAEMWGPSGPYYLAARLLSGPYEGYWVWKFQEDPSEGVIGYPALNADDSLYINYVAGPYFGSFPYGLDVEPD